ncbi:MAG TPA: non-homologous end-joining DNA ligase [Acidimicrobiia bacterium]|nr:non-homologous end-joining DNA ligase [Acidimicrobiia bacterium]
MPPPSVRFGVSGLPPGEPRDDAAFLDSLVEKGHTAYELAFVTEFPWKEPRCRKFGDLAAERGIWVSVHAPYFAVLTVEEEDRAKQCLAALEHTMKLGRALGSRIICAHFGAAQGRPPEQLIEMISTRLARIAPKIEHMGVGLGLETSGAERNFGTLGDIAVLADEFNFVRPVVDWAHVHAQSGGALTSTAAFASVIEFIRQSFPGWMIDPLQTQFTDNLFNAGGEVRHLPYGEGTLRVKPLVEAAVAAGLSMVVISEAREQSSHQAIQDELTAAVASSAPKASSGRPLDSGLVAFPDRLQVEKNGPNFRLGGPRPLKLTNLDKPFFPDGYTKGDLIQYYASVAPVLLPHLAGRPISMSRYPDGIGGPSFYEKKAPGHQPDWMDTAPVPSDSQGGNIDFLLASNRESLMWFANMGCIEVHPFHSRAGSLETPDLAIFDLDPAEGSSWDQIVAGAKLLRVALERLGLAGYPKLSGSKGLHVYVPIEPVLTHSRVRAFVEAVGRVMVAANPDDLTMEWDIPRRKGRVFIDHNRNAFGQTIASVYSVRPLPGAPVSVPITWDEVDVVRNGDITIANLWERLARFGDLWGPVVRGGQRLEEAESALGIDPG